MNARQVKKLKNKEKIKQIQKLKKIFSTHWERHITDQELQGILRSLLGGLNDKQFDEIIEKNKLNNNRYMKRKKLFSAKFLAKEIFEKYFNFPK